MTSLNLRRAPALLFALAWSAGCYLSHERPTPDASLEPDIDAGPAPVHRCRARCGEPEVIGTLRGMTGIEALLAVAARSTRVGLLVRQYNFRDGSDFPFYALVSIDYPSGTASMPVPSVDSSLAGMSAAGLHVHGDTFVATMLRSSDVGDVPTTATVAAAAWQIEDGEIAWTEPSLAVLPARLLPSGVRLGTGFGLADRSAAALVEGDTLWLAPVELDGSVRGLAPIPLVRWPSAPPRTTPLTGTLNADGTIVLAGGGYVEGRDPRAAFIVVASPGEEPSIEELPGGLFDPPPLLATRDVESYVFRYVTRVEDVPASGFVAESRDAQAMVVDRLELATTGGLVPAAAATYRGGRGAGLVWIEPSGDVHVLPSMEVFSSHSAWRDCGYDIDVPAVAHLPAGVSAFAARHGGVPMLAIGSAGGLVDVPGATDDILLLVLDGEGEGVGGSLTILRLPDCGVDRRPPE